MSTSDMELPHVQNQNFSKTCCNNESEKLIKVTYLPPRKCVKKTKIEKAEENIRYLR